MHIPDNFPVGTFTSRSSSLDGNSTVLEKVHVGFCMGLYNKYVCKDCPMEKECLELRDKEINIRRG